MTLTCERSCDRSVAEAYMRAKRAVIAAGYGSEIAWQEDAATAPITEHRFLSEAAWVVLSAGMKETVVRRVFPQISAAFAWFADAPAVLQSVGCGRAAALAVFRHEGKIDAIIDIARTMNGIGIVEIRRRLSLHGTVFLQELPYIGPVTAFHLAKNLGLEVAKPDRHLTRIANACGYPDVQVFCSNLREAVGEPVSVIDIVLWRFATLWTDYVERLTSPQLLVPATNPGSPS